MSSQNTPIEILTVFADGKDRQVKSVELAAGEEIRYTRGLSRLSTHSRHLITPGVLMVTTHRVVFSPSGYARKFPSEVWSVTLEDVENVYYERKKFNVKDLATGILIYIPVKIGRRFVKTLCIELSDGSKQYFTIEHGINLNLDHMRKAKVQAVIDTLRTEIKDARVAALIQSTDDEAEHDGDTQPRQEPSSEVTDTKLRDQPSDEEPGIINEESGNEVPDDPIKVNLVKVELPETMYTEAYKQGSRAARGGQTRSEQLYTDPVYEEFWKQGYKDGTAVKQCQSALPYLTRPNRVQLFHRGVDAAIDGLSWNNSPFYSWKKDSVWHDGYTCQSSVTDTGYPLPAVPSDISDDSDLDIRAQFHLGAIAARQEGSVNDNPWKTEGAWYELVSQRNHDAWLAGYETETKQELVDTGETPVSRVFNSINPTRLHLEFKFPKGAEVVMDRWLVEEGETVSRGQPIGILTYETMPGVVVAPDDAVVVNLPISINYDEDIITFYGSVETRSY